MRRLIPLLAALAIGCSPSLEGQGETAGGACSNRFPKLEPDLPAPARVTLPQSHLSVGVSVSEKRVGQELSRRVPIVLASAKRQHVGAPGDATYTVRRGNFAFRVRDDRLFVSTPVSAHIEVCKPIGPFCPTYGRCNPELLSVVSVPVVIGPGYELGGSNVSVNVTRRCAIAGLDVTPQIQRMASKQSGKLKRQIDRSLPSLRPNVESAWEMLHLPVALSTSTCLRVAPERVRQERPKQKNGSLATRLSISGQIRVEDPCDQKKRTPAKPLPKPEVVDQVPDHVELAVPVHIDWSDVSADLTRSLVEARGGQLRVVGARARATRDAVAIAATVEGPSCGEVWLLGDPVYDARTSRIRLKHVRAANADQAEQVAEVAALVQKHAAIALPVDVAGAPPALESLVERLTANRPEGVEVAVNMQPASVDSVLVGRAALIPIVSLEGTATVDVR